MRPVLQDIVKRSRANQQVAEELLTRLKNGNYSFSESVANELVKVITLSRDTSKRLADDLENKH
jgi:hypothetical protein